ncbi:MAG: hypothetical protein LOY03_12875 [Cyclobacteriaceae bacterium]|jgi:hypothetical protein|nr:hypothetical protein [Cyclobacteriaceae bacterium]
MIRAFFILATLGVLFSACTQRLVCPAFQSAFIYDKDALRKKFSYFQEDSTPKILTASKNRYLIAESVPYRKKLNSLATVEMKPVFPVVPDSLTMDQDVSLAELDAAARSVIDSTYIVDVVQPADTAEVADPDSTYVITRDKEVRMLRYNADSATYRIDDIRFNIDQDNYMWYLRDALVLPDVRLAQMQGKWEEEDAAREAKEKKGGFFRNLFKKKEKKQEVEPVDTLQVEPPVERSEFDFEYNENEPVQDTVTEAQPEKKKGFFSFLKKDKKDKRDRTKEAKTSDGPASDQAKPARERKKKAPKKDDPTDLKPADEEVQGDEGF